MKKIYLLLGLVSSLTFAQLATPSAQIQATTNATIGNVGIGTTNPSEKLEIQGNLKINNNAEHTFIRLGKEHSDEIIVDNSSSKYYGGGYFFRVHNDSTTHQYIDALMLADNGNVGIGVLNPTNKLDVDGSIRTKEIKFDVNNRVKLSIDNPTWQSQELLATSYDDNNGDHTDIKVVGYGKNNSLIRLNAHGNVGIGTTDPKHKLDVNGSFRAGNEDNQFTYNGLADIIFKFKERGNGGRAIVHDAGNTLSINYNEDFDGGTKLGNSFLVKGNNASLKGKFEAREIKVTESPTADFVFEEDYALPTLQEVEQHIKEKKHLPEIASAKQMEKEGVNIGEFQIQLLQKIEELTLYIIEQNKSISEQQKQIDNLNKKLEQSLYEK